MEKWMDDGYENAEEGGSKWKSRPSEEIKSKR